MGMSDIGSERAALKPPLFWNVLNEASPNGSAAVLSNLASPYQHKAFAFPKIAAIVSPQAVQLSKELHAPFSISPPPL